MGGESKRTEPHKIKALINRIDSLNQSIYLAAGELAIYRELAGPLDQGLFNNIMQRIPKQEWTSPNDFYESVRKCARERFTELEHLEAQQLQDALGNADTEPQAEPDSEQS